MGAVFADGQIGGLGLDLGEDALLGGGGEGGFRLGAEISLRD